MFRNRSGCVIHETSTGNDGIDIFNQIMRMLETKNRPRSRIGSFAKCDGLADGDFEVVASLVVGGAVWSVAAVFGHEITHFFGGGGRGSGGRG